VSSFVGGCKYTHLSSTSRYVSKILHFSKLTAVWLCAMALTLSSCAKKPAMNPMAAMMMQAAPVRAVAAISSDVPLNVSAVGNVEAISSVDVKSRVAGQIMRVDFQEGQNVQKGQLLFEIDPEPLQRQITELQAEIAKDEALEQQAHANVAKDQAILKQTHSAAQRGVELEKEGIFSKDQTEQLVATNGSTEASLQADQAAVQSAVASLKADHARLAQTQLQLEYTKITAPITGRAGAIAVRAGNLIKDNDAALVSILQISPIDVSFGIPEQLLPEIQKYNRQRPLVVEAGAQGAPTETGKLKFIDNTVDTTTGTVKLKAEFTNKDSSLWPGEFVNVTAQMDVQHDRIVVPSSTVENGPQGKYVWVVNPSTNTVAMRAVDVARTYKPAQAPEQAVIATGLQVGDVVVTQGQMRLFPGGKVRMLKPNGQMTDSHTPTPEGAS
jgi:multidrug efflux system membrane fusion protein